jgi:putative ABC transport system ATP-binding protein
VPLATLAWSEISIVPQSSGLLEDLTLIENVSLARRLRPQRDREDSGASARDRGHEAGELLSRLGLAHLSEHLPRATSLGEQQRAAVARAMLLGPSLVLADEPTAHQDAASAERVLDMFCQAADAGSCCLIATHSVAAISRAHRVITIAT